MGGRIPVSDTNKWAVPVPVSAVDLAFPAEVIGRLLPPMEEIPKDVHRSQGGLASRAFFSGLDARDLVENEGVDKGVALAQIQCCLGSFEPKHEHKIAGVNYLFSLFFTAESIERVLSAARNP